MCQSLARNFYDVYRPFQSVNTFKAERVKSAEYAERLIQVTGIFSSPRDPIVLIPHRDRTFADFIGRRLGKIELTTNDLALASSLLEAWIVYVEDLAFVGRVENPFDEAERCAEGLIDRVASESPPGYVDPILGCLTDVAKVLVDELENVRANCRNRVESVIRRWLRHRLRQA